MANSEDPEAVCSRSMMFASILNSSVMLGNYLQQTTSADNIFRYTLLSGGLLSGEMINLRSRDCWLETHLWHYVVSLSRLFIRSLVLVHPRNTGKRPDMSKIFLTET